MTEGFSNPLVGGGGSLVYPSIHSPNFVTGIAGWTINKDGSAELNNVTVRGTIIAGHFIGSGEGQEVLIYTGAPAANNLLASICSANGTDSHGNHFVAGTAVYSATIAMSLSPGASLTFFSGSLAAGWTSASSVGGDPSNLLLTSIGGQIKSVSVFLAQQGIAVPLPIGATVSGSNADLELHSLFGLASQAAPVTPPAGFVYVYFNSTDGLLHAKFPGGKDFKIEGDDWNSLGALGAHYTVTLGRYKFGQGNSVRLDIKVVGDGLQATSVTFANALAAAYRPATQHDSLAMGTTRAITAGDISPRLTVDTAGNVTVINQGTANTFGFTGDIPLD